MINKLKFIKNNCKEILIVLLFLINMFYVVHQSYELNNASLLQVELLKKVENEKVELDSTKQEIFNRIIEDLEVIERDSNLDYVFKLFGLDIQVQLEEELPENIVLAVNKMTKEFGFYYLSNKIIYPYQTYYLDTRENRGSLLEFNQYLDNSNGVFIHKYVGKIEDFNFQWAYSYNKSTGFLNKYELKWYPDDSLKIRFLSNVEGSYEK